MMRLKNFQYIFIVGWIMLMLSGWGCLKASAQVFTLPEGQSIEIKIIPEKETIMPGEPIYLFFEIHNHSEVDLQTMLGGDSRNRLGRPNSFTIKTVGDNGEIVPQPDAGINMGGFVIFPKIPAQGKYVEKLLLPHWATFTKTGTFTITCERTLVIGKYDQNAGGMETAKRGVSLSVAALARIEVMPLDAQAMGMTIDRLGRQMFAGNFMESWEAARLLSWVDDDRTFKYFALAVEGRNADVRFQALSVMEKFATDEALAILRREMHSPQESERNLVAVVLAKNKHPQARQLLLSMRRDAYYGVRLTVVHALGKMTDGASLQLLQEMTADDNEIVRREAERYVQERRAKVNL